MKQRDIFPRRVKPSTIRRWFSWLFREKRSGWDRRARVAKHPHDNC